MVRSRGSKKHWGEKKKKKIEHGNFEPMMCIRERNVVIGKGDLMVGHRAELQQARHELEMLKHAPDLQQVTVQRFKAVTKDLHSLNDGLYDQRETQRKAMAAMMERMEDLEVSNDALRAENKAQRKLLDAVQVTISRLEVLAAPPLIVRGRSAQRMSPPPHRPSNPPSVSHRRSSRSPPLRVASKGVLPHMRSRSPPPRAASKGSVPQIRSRSYSPMGQLNMKRPRTEPEPVFISFGPVIESAEPPVKYFELHLRTAIPSFVLAAPYQVQRDPVYPGHLRVKLASESVAKSFIDASGRQTVAGYSKIKIYKMGFVSGNEPRTGNNQSQSGLYNFLNVIFWNVRTDSCDFGTYPRNRVTTSLSSDFNKSSQIWRHPWHASYARCFLLDKLHIAVVSYMQFAKGRRTTACCDWWIPGIFYLGGGDSSRTPAYSAGGEVLRVLAGVLPRQRGRPVHSTASVLCARPPGISVCSVGIL
ncbi:hypothetical protein C8R43DRAFT_952890 [Mycena crocata]|nr:hypothetical protein C8R43DRAFT_952890 [Mycena crocata]